MHAPSRLIALFAAAALAACGGTPPTGNGVDGGDGQVGDDGTGGGGGDGGGGGGGGEQAQAPFPKENACEVLTSQASLENKPVDIVMVIDNSGSMTQEAVAVEENINQNFAEILNNSGLDYRVILLARHGSASGSQSVCIKAPLSGTSCDPIPSQPANTERFFQYDTEIGSTDGLSKFLSTYGSTDTHGFAQGGWKTWLREGSFKTILMITDDESSITAESFESQLFALSPAGTFGDELKREYIFHSIIGIRANDPVTSPWLPTDPAQNEMCSSAAKAGIRYEDLSLRTGGLRFPVCETSSYNAVFQAAAQSVIENAVLSCEFDAPMPTDGTKFQDAYVEYTPGDGSTVEYLRNVSDAANCSPNHFTSDLNTGRITLCPEACTRLKSDDSAKLDVVYACGVDIG